MDNLLEQQRHCHEEIERIEKAIVQQYMSETPTQFEQYVNLKNVPKMDYLQYLRELDNFASISPASKTQLYRDYLTSLVHYLEGYFDRALPLFNLQALQSRVEADFNAAWRKRSVPGWEDAPDYQALFPLYCYACRKQYTKQTVYDAHLKGRKHQKATRALEHQQSNPTEPAAVRQAQQQTIDELDAKRKTMALLEALLTGYLEQLGDKRENTRANIERKQALTEEERRAELQEDDDVDVNQYESDEEDQIYNPLNLPLDWDGKPIPYWLYKLHGLRVNYACEICGNYTYRGRKAFDKHFQEWRHLHGLRCLNIRANRQFYGITSIADAQALWDKIKAEEKSEEVQLNQAEEYEDNQGNVFNKKTYEDLKRQGLL
ncbi:Pre-mRNA-splicing factor sap61 [Dimargaris verticillata]|uniref:Pre-mRNA-splicing factor sap61 n=1 Tax=Dimargaris verticillata TaxID=2761393 RepID=A0A9W8B2L9_9FUNG|nr:Pre-mRNA-splicing factor sap61 [Dimargaris verticillata]